MTKTPQHHVPELRFPEFEGEWEEKRIGELTTKIGSGKTPKGGSENYLSKGIPFFRSQNIQDGQLSLNELVYIDSNTDDSMKNSRSYHGDILLNITGASIGRSAINTLTSTHANLNQHVCIIRVKKEFYYGFLGKFLLSPQGKKVILKAQSGGSREGLNFKEISKIKLYIPNIFSEQEKIGEFFSKLDRQIELEEQKLEKLEEQKKGYMQKIFSQELRFKGENGNEYPEWEEKKFVEMFHVIPSKKYQIKSSEIEDSANFPVVDQGQNLILGFSNNKDKVFENFKDVIIYGDHTTFVKKIDEPFIIGGDGVKLLTSRIESDLTYLYNVLRYFNVKPEGYKRHFSILKKKCLNISASIEEQKKIGVFLERLDNLIEAQSIKVKQLQQRKLGLLQKMFV